MLTHVDQATRDYHEEQAAKARSLFIAGLTSADSAHDWHESLRLATSSILDCLTVTDNLADVRAGLVLSGAHVMILRYLLAPPASQDRFSLICPEYQKTSENDAKAVLPTRADAIASVFSQWRDAPLTKWLQEKRSPTAVEVAEAVARVAPLVASQKVNTVRRNRLSGEQEIQVVNLLQANGWTRVASQSVDTRATLPAKHFMRKTRFATQQRPQEVDIACGLGGTVVCAMECKVTNDDTNSIKRVNDVLKKAKAWQDHWGSFVRTAALLQGVVRFTDVNRLLTSGVRVFWSHDLSRFLVWVENPN